jgi:hypothetical protein
MNRIEPHMPSTPSQRRLRHEPLPAALHFLPPAGGEHKPVRLFVEERRELASALNSCRAQLPAGSEVWVSWPKRASQLPTDITEEVVRDFAFRLGFVDVKTSAVSEVWSLLKLVLRPARVEASSSPTPRTLTLVEEGRRAQRS